LPSGGIFVAGGVDSSGNALDLTAIITASSVKDGPRLKQARLGHTATVLSNGQILIAGGQTDSAGKTVLGTTEIYDPLANGITAGPALNTARTEAVAVAFGPSGSQHVLVAGGSNGTASLQSAEELDVTAMKFTALTAKMAEPAASAGAALLDDGTIAIAGGVGANGPAGAEIFDPTAGTFSATTMSVHRSGAAFAATGREAIVAGGTSSVGDEKTTEVYDIAAKVFALGPSLSAGRHDATATLVNGTEIVVIGGRNGSTAVGTVEVLTGSSLAQATVSSSKSLTTPRYGHTTTVLSTGQILVVGGLDKSGAALASIENVTLTATAPLPTAPSTTTTPSPPSTVPGSTTGTTGTAPGSTGTTSPGSTASSGGSSFLTTILNLLMSLLGGGSGGSSSLTSLLGSLLGGGSGSSGGLGSLLSGLLGGSSSGTSGTSGSSGFGSILSSLLSGLLGGSSGSSSSSGGFGSILTSLLSSLLGGSGGSGSGLSSLLSGLFGGSSSSSSTSGGLGSLLGSLLGGLFGGSSGGSTTPGSTATATLTITSFTPSSGTVGTTVTVNVTGWTGPGYGVALDDGSGTQAGIYNPTAPANAVPGSSGALTITFQVPTVPKGKQYYIDVADFTSSGTQTAFAQSSTKITIN
jgi:hypothetical protein